MVCVHSINVFKGDLYGLIR